MKPADVCLVIGLLFPAISLLTGIGSFVVHWRHKRHSSPLFVPFVGPILLTLWLLLTKKPLWLVPVVWVLDIGTLAFLAIGPRLIADWWRVSSFTKILTLRGARDIQTAIITLHSTGHYVLFKSCGIASLGEPGVFA